MSSSSGMSSNSTMSDEEDGHQFASALQESKVGDLFNLAQKFGLAKISELDLHTKYSIGQINYFAFTLNKTGDLLLLTGCASSLHDKDEEIDERSWSFKYLPWFADQSKRITALSFDEEGLLYIGTNDGTVYELNVTAVFNAFALGETDLKQTFHLDECRIIDILIWFRDTTKIVMCNGGGGKFIFIYSNSLPVLVTFNSLISTMHLFINNTGLSALLVCLQNNQNVTTVLDDLDVPPQEESIVKKSIFRRAKENIISRFGDSDKGLIFGRRTSRDLGGGSGQEIPISSTESLTTVAPPKPTAATTAPISKPSSVNVRFTTLEELSSRGPMLKICGKNQFYRHVGTKLDVFEADFRQIASMNLPENISKLFVIDKVFYGVDTENGCLRLSVIHSQMLKEFAIIPFSAKILSVEPAGEMGTMEQLSVFLISTEGIFFMALKKPPRDICADLLMGENASSLFDVICTALNVAKNEVYILAGDKSAEEGKFAKTILYYKVAGMTYSKIVAKFGSRRMVPAMLCFYDLVDNEKTKFSGPLTERNMMADLILQGRVEQYLRHGTKVDPAKDPRTLLLQFIQHNEYYSSELAASALSYPQLLWAAKCLSEARVCYSDIFQGLFSHQNYFNSPRDFVPPFWSLLVSDWKAIYGAPPPVFCWFRDALLPALPNFECETVCRLCKSLMPWRRELLRKFFCDVSDVTESIDFTQAQGAKKITNEDFVNLFIHIMLEAISRNETTPCRLSTLFYQWEANAMKRRVKQASPENYIENSLLASTEGSLKTFSASATHCLCIRNGRLYGWGDNRLGRLGVKVNREKFSGPIEIPIPVSLAPSLKLVIASVSCGQAHSLALTTGGAILAFGSNKYGQLGIGRSCVLSETAVFPYLPSATFICVAAGGYHSVAVDHLNRPWTWGWGVYGQLGTKDIENIWYPSRILVKEKIVMASAGHSHTALLTATGKVLTFGCSHFGQIGQGTPNIKVKVPTAVVLPLGVIGRSIECGLTSTIIVTMRNRIFYSGMNPSCVRTMLSGARKKAADGRNGPPQPPAEAEEKDFSVPTLIETSHLAGEIVKVNAATTHFGVLTNTGLVYSWGLGKNGQLMRPEDDCKSLDLIDTEDRVLVASDVLCAGECSWVVEKDSGRIFGYGFNSSGQLGRMDTDQESTILTIKTKKRVLRVRQPANVHYKPKEVTGLPRKSLVAETENAILPTAQILPPTETVGNELLVWVLETFHRNYSPDYVVSICTQYENHEGGATVCRMERDYEGVLQHRLREKGAKEEKLVGEYAETKERETNCLQETYRFVDILVGHWMKRNLVGSALEEILMPYYKRSPWNSFISRAIREMISETNERSKWIAGNFSPSFILACIRDSKVSLLEEDAFLSRNGSEGIGGKIRKGGKFELQQPHQNGLPLECD